MQDKVLAAWGAGIICRNYLLYGLKNAVEVIIDNDVRKSGMEIEGVPIVHPSQVGDWSRYFIIILSRYESEIMEQLLGYGLIKGRDFASYKAYCGRDIPLEYIQETLVDTIFDADEKKHVEICVRSKQEYDKVKMQLKHHVKYESALNRMYQKMPGKLGGYLATCAACGKEQAFIVDYVWSDGERPAWRETVTCPECSCNSRMRFVVDYVGRVPKDKSIFMYEYVTNTFAQLHKKFPNLQGSEYLGEEYTSGQIVDGVMHQDAMKLSFLDESFDYMVSNDVMEHIADYKCALQETLRCLKKGGHFVFSIPIFKDREKTVIRTRMKDNELEYIQPPIYHGNPLSADGSLVFSEFGWDILEELRLAGFSDAYAVVYSSVEKGYFGECPVIFEAIK